MAEFGNYRTFSGTAIVAHPEAATPPSASVRRGNDGASFVKFDSAFETVRSDASVRVDLSAAGAQILRQRYGRARHRVAGPVPRLLRGYPTGSSDGQRIWRVSLAQAGRALPFQSEG